MTKEQYIQQGFNEQMEKMAALGLLARIASKILPKLARGATRVGATRTAKWATEGAEAVAKGNGMKYFSRFGDTRFTKGPSGDIGFIDAADPAANSFLAKVTGNITRGVSTLSRGVAKQEGIVNKAVQVGKNLAANTRQNFRNARYVTKPADGLGDLKAGDKVGKIPGLRKKVVRKVRRGGKDYYVLQRSGPGRLFQYSTTPEVMGGTALLSAPNASSGAADAAIEYGTWGYARPLAYAKMVKDLI